MIPPFEPCGHTTIPESATRGTRLGYYACSEAVSGILKSQVNSSTLNSTGTAYSVRLVTPTSIKEAVLFNRKSCRGPGARMP